MTHDDLAHQALIRDLGRRLQLASPDEVRVVDRVFQRLELGRERYGALDLSRPRAWRRELREELLDALVYDVCEELAVEDIGRAELRAAAAAEQEQLRAAMVDTPQARAAIREYRERAAKRLGAAPVVLTAQAAANLSVIATSAAASHASVPPYEAIEIVFDDAEPTGEGGSR